MKHADLVAGETYWIETSKHGGGTRARLVSTDRVRVGKFENDWKASPDGFRRAADGNRVVFERLDRIPSARYESVPFAAIKDTAAEHDRKAAEYAATQVRLDRERREREAVRAGEKALIVQSLAEFGITTAEAPREEYARVWRIQEADLVRLIEAARG